MSSRGTRSTGAGYTAHVERPSKQRAVSSRAIFGLVLTVLLPPVGLLFLWHQGVFRARGRVLLTALATVEMAALVVWLTPHAELTPRTPIPAAPPQVTAAPEGETLNALYNIEQLLYEQQLAQVLEQGGTASDLLTEEQKLEVANQQNEEAYETVVYSVFGDDAIYYHATKVCRTQTNGRELTVRDALREGLQPCPYCNPPTVTA
ncbi:MAG: hypothetical protein IJ769_07595 [Clostridia bacterium]|nr:hypothetical protein [Clostridia bacterium]